MSSTLDVCPTWRSPQSLDGVETSPQSLDDVDTSPQSLDGVDTSTHQMTINQIIILVQTFYLTNLVKYIFISHYIAVNMNSLASSIDDDLNMLITTAGVVAVNTLAMTLADGDPNMLSMSNTA